MAGGPGVLMRPQLIDQSSYCIQLSRKGIPDRGMTFRGGDRKAAHMVEQRLPPNDLGLRPGFHMVLDRREMMGI